MSLSRYREKIYSQYVETLRRHSENLDDSREYERRKRIYDLNYEKFLPSDKNSKILELGCGKGFFLKYLKEKGYFNIKGVEKSSSQLFHALPDTREYIVFDDMFNYLRDSSEEFDLIALFHVLEHLFKDEILDLLELIYKRLSKAGILIIEVPNAGSPIFGSNNRYAEFTHEVGFTPSSLREVILVTGFKNVTVYPIKGLSLKARFVFHIVNAFFHSRFSKDLYIDGEIYAVAQKN